MNITPALLRFAAACSVLGLAVACDGPGSPASERSGQSFASLITETDSLRCGTSEVIHKNRGKDTLRFHIKVRDFCLDTLPELGVSRVIVEDSMGRALTIDTVVGQTFRGTLALPPGTRIKLECLRTSVFPAQCVWEYKYNLP